MPSRLRTCPSSSFLAIFALALCVSVAPLSAQQHQPGKNADAEIVISDAEPAPHEGKPSVDTAWSMLTTAAKTSKHPDTRIQALAALGTLGSDGRAEKLISDGMNDADLDVRTAAILAAGQSGNRNLTTDIRAKLDDAEPQVVFTAATALWKMKDRSGEDILIAVVDGERTAAPGIVQGTRHTVVRDLHNPSTLARIGATQGAAMFLGPFGFGLTALEYLRKNGGDTARIAAIELLAEEHNGPIRGKLIAALADKDPGVRAAAAKALGLTHDPSVSADLGTLFTDPKNPVRLTAAAAFLNASAPPPPAVAAPATPRRRHRS